MGSEGSRRGQVPPKSSFKAGIPLRSEFHQHLI